MAWFFGLDQLEELLGELGLLDAAQSGNGEGMPGGLFSMVVLLARPNG